MKIELTGLGPMLQHSERLANPRDPYAKKLGEFTAIKGRQKTDEIIAQQVYWEARGGCWETDDGFLGIPRRAAFASLYNAAKATKQGKQVERAILFADVVDPILINGAPVSCDSHLADGSNIDIRSVGVNGRRVMRSRPIVPAGWQCVIEFELLPDVLDERNLLPILERAGRLERIGDFRRAFGQYRARVVD